jgi:aryl-alcohol dehydrogenase-like predicted oxidoreductase
VRAETDTYGHQLYGEEIGEADARVIGRLEALAREAGVAPAQMALAWLLQKPAVVAPIVGVSKAHHLEEAIAALDVSLDAKSIARLEEPYLPHPIAGI